jgi:predicted nuclease of restriction endonuclease-like (RecB) superfamily
LIVSDRDKWAFYEQECINFAWSVHELKRQIETSLLERHLFFQGLTNEKPQGLPCGITDIHALFQSPKQKGHPL